MKSRTRAFTLVEMLVALAITSLLVVLLVNVVSAALAVWEQGRNQIDTFANARQVLGRIADEISGATAAPSPRPIEFSENVAFAGGPVPVPNTSENIFLVAPYPNTAPGDLCVVAYRHNGLTPASAPSPTPPPYSLQRAFVDSQVSWNGGAANRYQSAGYDTSTWQWRTIATGVLEFEIQSYSQQDLDTTTSPSPTPIPSWNSTTSGTMSGNTPREVVIRIKVVDDRTLVKLTGLTPTDPTYIRLVNRAARQFTANVMLPPPH